MEENVKAQEEKDRLHYITNKEQKVIYAPSVGDE